jgi:hypothetical protein
MINRAASQRKWRYGVDHITYLTLLDKQDGRCAICGDGGQLQVDHDHKCCAGTRSCGECIRGLLCGPCNRGLAAFGDDPEKMRKATAYLN